MYGSRRSYDNAQDDLDFLAKVKTASYQHLLVMLKNHCHKNVPEWKVVAIERAIRRILLSSP